MTPQQSIQLVIQAFAVGIAVPLLIQLFLTLRTAQRTIVSLRARTERTLDGLEGVTARVGTPSVGSQALSALGVALGAALKAWRAGMTGDRAQTKTNFDPSTPLESSEQTTRRENHHARS